MRQTAEKAVPFTKSAAKPQRESEKTNKNKKTSRNAGGKITGTIWHKAGFITIVKSEPQSLPLCLGKSRRQVKADIAKTRMQETDAKTQPM